MSTEEHLNRIVAKCRELLAMNPGVPRRRYDQAAEAGWRATIAAIDEILPYITEVDASSGASVPGHRFVLNLRAKAIIAAWPEELL